MRPRSLRAIVALYIAAILMALVGLRIANYVVAHDALRNEVDRRLAIEAGEIIGHDQPPDIAMIANRVARAQRDHDTADLYLLLADARGRLVAGNLRLSALPAPGFTDLGEAARVEGVRRGRALVRRLANGATLVVLSDNDIIDQFDAVSARVQLFGLAVTLLIVVGGAVAMTMTIGERMRAMQRTVDAVMAGDLQSRVPLDGSLSEFDRQAMAFNKMLDRIGELMVGVRHAARDVAHELKGPLARLRARMAALARQSGGQRAERDLAGLLAELDRAIELFGSVSRLWEVEGGQRRERFVDLDAGALVEEIFDTLKDVAEEAGQRLILGQADAAPIRGDRNLLCQLLINLVENAISHTPSGTRIILSARVRGPLVTLSVVDDGPGIPPDQHAAAIRKFGRLDSAGSDGGQGLGLSLVEAIARLHDGRFMLGDAQPGLQATITLPLGV